ncbi:MAG: hypothetical protein LUH47_10525, partial [Clostridiales bacterium]|nr:hypothetical protein [Clostridiales bacterium]
MLIIFPKEAVHAASRGLVLWYTAALPSLFPFAVGTSLLINLNFVSLISKTAAPFSKKFLGISPEGFFVFLSGITSGYPIGIQTLTEMYSAGHISKSEAVRLSAYCSNSGPLFILGSVGTVMLADPKAALTILSCHYAAPLILGIVLRHTYPSEKNTARKISLKSKNFGKALSLS